MDNADKVLKACGEISANFARLAACADSITDAASLMVKALESGGKVMFCGNGGSAADSQHLAAELMGKYLRDRSPLAAMALTVDTSALTAIGNDYGFAKVFSRQVEGVGRSGDVLVGLSTSGRSANVVQAAQAARERGIAVVALTGQDGGELAQQADVAICVPAARADRIQEMHIAAGHMICEMVEGALC